ncbi:hypothetical protein DFH06DRAFT_1316807 [Mycena polygramma]|nr:hypothetical protein DFH06DRAFT_1316807 [Mycena polygramma]
MRAAQTGAPPQPWGTVFTGSSAAQTRKTPSKCLFGYTVLSILPDLLDSPVHAASLVDPATRAPALIRHVTHGRSAHSESPYLIKLSTLVLTVLTRAKVTPATVLIALVYITSAHPYLTIALEEWACSTPTTPR